MERSLYPPITKSVSQATAADKKHLQAHCKGTAFKGTAFKRTVFKRTVFKRTGEGTVMALYLRALSPHTKLLYSLPS